MDFKWVEQASDLRRLLQNSSALAAEVVPWLSGARFSFPAFLLSSRNLRQRRLLSIPQWQRHYHLFQLQHFQRTLRPVVPPAHNQIAAQYRMLVKKKIPAFVL